MILLASTSAFVTFLAIAVFGFIFVIASSILGDVFEHGDFGHDADGHGAGPSLLSSRILSVFVTAFGSFGAIGIHLGYGVGVSTAMGFGGGVLFAGVIYVFASFSIQPASFQPRPDGRPGGQHGAGERRHSQRGSGPGALHAG